MASFNSSYGSSLHYILLLPVDCTFKGFLLHFTNEDIAKLDISILESSLRDVFIERLGVFYDNNSILFRSELERIVKRNITLTK